MPGHWFDQQFHHVIVAAVLSTLHLLTLALGLGAVFMRGRALARPLDEAGWQRLLAADSAWGLAAVLWIGTGLARVFYGGKGPYFYFHNGFFWIKLGLFALVFLLETAPMTTFVHARIGQRRGAPRPVFPVRVYLAINTVELVLVVTIVFCAALMARAVWMFE
jgi:putative membrane protein